MKKNAAESHRILVEVYDHALAEQTCQKWFAKDCCQTQEELAESLEVTQAAI